MQKSTRDRIRYPFRVKCPSSIIHSLEHGLIGSHFYRLLHVVYQMVTPEVKADPILPTAQQ